MHSSYAKIYLDTYCSKEAGIGTAIGAGLARLPNLLSIPGRLITKLHSRFVNYPNPAKWALKLALKSPIVGLTAIGAPLALGGYGAKKYIDYKKDNNPVYKLKKWIEENPWQAAAVAGGLITSPLWLPPAVEFATNGFSRDGKRYGASKNNYQMGYYPGR